MSKRKFLLAKHFEPHPEDAGAIEQLAPARCTFGLTPRGRIYAVAGRLGDSNVEALLQLPFLIEVTVSNMVADPIFTDSGFEQLLLQSSLQIFGCAQNQALTDKSVAVLSSASRMRWLCLNGCAITDIGVEHISEYGQLFGLYLADNQITNQCVPHLCRLTKLRRLRLTGTLVTESFRDKLAAHLPKCRSMQLGTEGNCSSQTDNMDPATE